MYIIIRTNNYYLQTTICDINNKIRLRP